jgi:hypothetical protein
MLPQVREAARARDVGARGGAAAVRAEWEAVREAEGRAMGVREAARVLAKSCDVELICLHLPLLLETDAEQGLRVLTDARRVDALPAERLLELLRERKDDLRRRFLDHMVTHWHVQQAEKHTELALCLLDEVQEAAWRREGRVPSQQQVCPPHGFHSHSLAR